MSKFLLDTDPFIQSVRIFPRVIVTPCYSLEHKDHPSVRTISK